MENPIRQICSLCRLPLEKMRVKKGQKFICNRCLKLKAKRYYQKKKYARLNAKGKSDTHARSSKK